MERKAGNPFISGAAENAASEANVAADDDAPPPQYTAEQPGISIDLAGDAPEQHRKLHDVLRATQHVAAALVDVNAGIDDVRPKHKAAAKTLADTRAVADRERDEWVKAKGSRLDRLFRRDKYDAAVKKEGDEFDAAYEWQVRAQAAEEVLRAQLDALTDKRNALWKLEVKRKTAKRQLLLLYDEVFAGPTPAHPDEDRLEAECAALQAIADGLDAQVSRLDQAAYMVDSARQSMQSAHEAIVSARRTTLDNAGGAALDVLATVADVAMPRPHNTYLTSDDERRRRTYHDFTGGVTSKVRGLVAHADQTVAAAQRLDPSVLADGAPAFPTLPVGENGGDTAAATAGRWLNAPITDIMCHGALMDIGDAVDAVAALLVDESRRADARLQAKRGERKPALEHLDRANDELFALRAELFNAEVARQKGEYKRADSI